MNNSENFLNIIHLPSRDGLKDIESLSGYYDSEQLDLDIRALLTAQLGYETVKGNKILIKPNWVRHSLKPGDELCLRTNDRVLTAALRILLEMSPSGVIIGDAPIQGCQWDKIVTANLIGSVNRISDEFSIPVRINDFRRRTFTISGNNPEIGIRPLSEYVIFDLGIDSNLEPVTDMKLNRFRVTDYDPDRMEFAHSKGIHKYCIIKDLFEADIVVSLPKIKTHQKTLITGAMKNLVGFNGDKDFLPHHRYGGTGTGGDCYPGNSLLMQWSESLLDKANRHQGQYIYRIWQKLSSLMWKLSFPDREQNLAAGWYGNDTTWRMVKDLIRISEYGLPDGTLSREPVRKIYSLCDGIIAGQGNGPLLPDPFPLGILSFTDNSLLNDRIMALLMDLPYEIIPLLSGNGIECGITGSRITLNDRSILPEGLKDYVLRANPPDGWVDHVNKCR